MDSGTATPQGGGLPHSEIHGSKGARPSPRLFAACHVLHRLSVPRHPPNALRRLISAADKTAHAPEIKSPRLLAEAEPHTRASRGLNPQQSLPEQFSHTGSRHPRSTRPQTPTPDRTAPVTFLFTMSNTHADRRPRHHPQSRLSYSDPSLLQLVEADGIEPTTSSLQS